MQTTSLRTGLLLILTGALAAACAHGSKQLTSLPKEGTASAAGNAHATVVLFRLAIDSDAQPVQASLSAAPSWKWHFLVNVGPMGHALDTGDAFVAGQLDATATDAGWAFVTLPPGTYELAFAAYRTRFKMPGAQRAALGFGQSSASRLDLPSGADLLYVGTFGFTCHKVDRWWAYVDRECTKLEIRDDEQLARQIAAASLRRFGPLRTVLAWSPE